MRIETITFEYEHCGECSNADTAVGDNTWRCFKIKSCRKIPSLWNKPIPAWCPLPESEVHP